MSSIRERSLKTASKCNDAILVVAVLIATATYLVGFSPPGGVWQENSSNPTAHNVHHAGQMTVSFYNALFILAFNGGGFKCRYGSIIRYIFPTRDDQLEGILAIISVLAFRLIIATMLCATFVAFTIDNCRRHRVDFPDCFSP
ncbi:Ankyrin repeat family protein [Raphanus sativus]|nr:Ankyrin repeat family protein [Raphanus sativus]